MAQRTVRRGLVGRRIGRLSVVSLEKVDKCRSASGKERYEYYFRCVCDCGSEVIVRGVNLYSRRTLSCGCLRAEKCAETGRKYGNRVGRIVKGYQRQFDAIAETEIEYRGRIEEHEEGAEIAAYLKELEACGN